MGTVTMEQGRTAFHPTDRDFPVPEASVRRSATRWAPAGRRPTDSKRVDGEIARQLASAAIRSPRVKAVASVRVVESLAGSKVFGRSYSEHRALLDALQASDAAPATQVHDDHCRQVQPRLTGLGRSTHNAPNRLAGGSADGL